MNKFLMILIFNVFLFPCCSMQKVVIQHGDCSCYAIDIQGIIHNIHSDNMMMDWCKKELEKVHAILVKPTISVEEYEKMYSITSEILPEFSGKDKKILKKILSVSIFKLLDHGVHNFIGSSFYPDEEDLESIKIDGKSVTPEEFLQIQHILEEEFSAGKGSEAFVKAKNSIVR